VTPTNVPVTVKLKTVDGTAVAGQDYVAKSFDLVFQPGDAPKIVKVPVLGDTADEGNELFFLRFESVSLGYVSGFGQAVILDDDGPRSPLCVAGTQIAAPRLVISNLGDAPGNEVLSFGGKLVFPVGSPAGYAPLDSIARGAQVRIENLGAGTMYI